MKKVRNRITALFLVLTMLTGGLPQSTLTAVAVERKQHTDAQKYIEKDQQDDTVSEASEQEENTEENNSTKEESIEEQSSEKESIKEEFSESASIEKESSENKFSEIKSTEEQVTEKQTSEESSSTDRTTAEESFVIEETLSEKQETEESSMMVETTAETTEIEETETEEIKRQTEEVGIKKKGEGYNNPNVTWILYEDGRLVVEGTGDFVTGDIAPWCDVHSSMCCSRDIKTAEVKVTGMTSLEGLFNGCSNLRSVDFSGCDMSTVTNMADMFNECSSLTNLDVSGWDTSNVKNMKYMFYNSGFVTLDLSDLNTSNVTNMEYMFGNCRDLTTLKLNTQKNGWNTGNVTTMEDMFYECGNLSDLQISEWDTSKVIYMNAMFNRCGNLSNIDVGNWNTSSVTSMEEMFRDCRSLTQLDVSKWDTQNVVTMERMFEDCNKLTNLNLSEWNTENVKYITYMFYQCNSMTSLDLSSFNLKNVQSNNNLSFIDMFVYNEKLESISNPLYVDKELPLPEKTGHLWRRENGIAKKVLEYGLKEGESILLTNNRMVGIEFLGKSFTLQDENGNKMDIKPSLTVDKETYGEKVVDIGAKDSFTFTVVPEEGYTLKSIKTTREDSTVIVEQGNKPNQYTIKPKEAESGYTRDEQITVEIVEVQNYALKIAYKDQDIIDAFIVNDSTQTDGKPEEIQVSNNSTTNLYIKVDNVDDIDRMEPVVSILKSDGYDAYSETIPHQNAGALTDQEKKLVGEGYYIFRLGTLHEALSIEVEVRYLLSEDDIASGKSEDVWWVVDRNGRLKVKGVGDVSSNGYMDNGHWYRMLPWSSVGIDSITSAVVNWTGMINASQMFDSHTNMTTVDLRNFDTSSIIDMGQMFYGCDKLQFVELSNYSAGNVTNMSQMFCGCDNLEKVVLKGLNTTSLTNTSQMFCGCTKLKEIDLSGIDTSNVTYMSGMFGSCDSLVTLDLSNFQTSNVTDMRGMFDGCINLATLDISSFDTRNVMDMGYMFSSCMNLRALDVSKFDTSNVADMGSMFVECEQLQKLDVSSFNTSNVIDMRSMFAYCKNLTAFDFSKFDTDNVTDMSFMFCNCNNLTSLDLSTFNTSNVTNFSYMFQGCENLSRLDLSTFNTSNVTNFSYMFEGCRNLSILDLNSFDMGRADRVNNFINECNALKEIKTPINMVKFILLPILDGSKWRDSDGTSFSIFPQSQQESITLTANRIAVIFTGDNFIVTDAEEKPMTAGQETLALIGTKEPMTFTIEPTEGYLLKSVVPASQTPTVKAEQGVEKGQYTVTPLDMDNGYVCDEELQVITIPIIYSQLYINYPYEGIADWIVVHQGTWTRQMPSSVQVSNAENTMLYVKMVPNNARTVQFPSVIINSVDENGQWYSKSVPIQSDLSSMGEQEQELVRSGYTAFDLGYLYGNADVSVSIKTVHDMGFELSGFPGDVQIIRYLPDENNVMRGEECTGGITAERGDTVYFQIKWEDTPEDAYRFCKTNISIPENTDSYLSIHQFSGVEGEVWGLTLYNDIVVQAKLEPHRIMFSYVTSDITYLQVTDGNAQISSDMRTLECYGGNALSLSFGLAENIILKDIATNGAEFDMAQKDGIYTVTVRDSTKIPQISQITLETEDALGRYSLSDLDCKVEYWQSSVPYEGKPVQPAIRRVTVRLPGSKKETVLKEKTDYTISCLNNIQAGEATLVITAAERSQRYRGSVVVPFTISKAAAPAVKDTFIQLEEISAGIVQQVDLSEYCVVDTAFEREVKPIGYRLDLEDWECSLGGVLKGDPVLQGSTLTIHTWPDADKYSDPAYLIVWASFANYEDTRLKLRIQFVKKEELTLAGTVTVADKVYDGIQVTPDPSGVYVEGKPASASDKIMQELDGWLTYHYTGINGTEYDSSDAPMEVGTYQVSVAISEDNFDYSAGYILAGSFAITKRPLWIEAESLTLFVNDSAPTGYYYRMEPDTEEILTSIGLIAGDTMISEPLISCDTLNMKQTGEYPVIVDVSQVQIYNQWNQEVTRNYSFDIKEGKVTVTYPKAGSYTVTYSLSGRGNDIIRSGMEAGSLLTRPIDPTADGYVFLGWYKDEKLAQLWDFDTDIIQENMTLYAGWAAGVTENKGVTLCIQQIADQIYTGKALKPTVTVYASDGTTLLKAGKDYSVSYTNNIDADTSGKKFGNGPIPKGGLGVRKDRTIDTSEGFDEKLAYAVVTGKGNYAGTVCMNFHINAASIGGGSGSEESMPAAGFTLKYTDQFEARTGKNAKIVSSLKYQKTLKSGTDYVLSVQDMEGKDIALTQKGELPLQVGNYILTITGQGNFTGSIVKKLYVSSKDKLMKNAKITYTKTVKDATKERLQQGITQLEFRVSISGSTLSENDFEVSYTDNHAIGTAAMTIHGKNGYVGTKRVTFKIKGIAFKEKEFAPIQLEDLTYNGTALTQNDVQLKPINNTEALVYGTDYIIGYKNNIKKGKASVIFTAKPSSGYSGSFKKTFSIKPLSLETGDIIKRGIVVNGSRLILTEPVPYRKGGAVPLDRFSLRVMNTGTMLQVGKDYTVKCNNNTEVSNGKAFMVLSGKGNFTGSITVYYDITNASLFQLYQEGSITVTTTASRFTSKMVYDPEIEDYYDKYEDREYVPSITIKDGKKTLKEGEDYEISYYGCAQNDVRDWQSAVPYVEIQGIGSYGGVDGRDEGDVITKPLSVYQKKLSANTLYIVYGEEAGYTYTGQQITPEIAVYYGNAADIKKAKNAKETDEDILTTPKPDKDDFEPGEQIPYEYGLTRLYPSRGREGGNYLLEYGENIAQGKNGTIKLIGVGGCTGSVTVKFTIGKKPIYYEDVETEE